MFLEDLHLDGADAGAITWGDEIPADVRADAHVVVIGCGESGLLAGIRLAQAGLPFTIVEKNGGPGGTWWENRYPGARVDIGSHFYCYSFEPADHWTEYFSQQPELQAYFERVMRQARHRASTAGSTPRSSRADVRRGDRPLGGRRSARPTAPPRCSTPAFVISAVGALNQPQLPDIPGMDDFAGPVVPLRAVGPLGRLPGQAVRARRRRRAAASRSRRRSPTRSSSSPCSSAPRSGCSRTRTTTERVPDGDRWAMRHLPFYGRWFRFLTFYPGAGLTHRALAHRPRATTTDGARDQRDATRATRELFAELDRRRSSATTPSCSAKVIPDYPADRQAHAAGQRLVARVPARRTTSSWCAPASSASSPTASSPSTARFHPADVICYATGFRHNDYLWPMTITGRDGAALREQWGDEPTAYLGITVPNFPNLFCLYGPGTNLAHGASLIFQSECQVNYVMERDPRAARRPGTARIEPRPRCTTSTPTRYQERDRADGVGAPVGEALALQEPRRARSSRSRRGRSPRTGRGRRPSSRRTTSGPDPGPASGAGVWWAISSTQVTLDGGSVTPPLASASPRRPSMNRAWCSGESHTSITTQRAVLVRGRPEWLTSLGPVAVTGGRVDAERGVHRAYSFW